LKLKSWMFQIAVIQPQLPETRPRSLFTCRITRIVIPWNLTSIREMTKLEFERTSLIVLIASHFLRNILKRSLNNQKPMRILSHIWSIMIMSRIRTFYWIREQEMHHFKILKTRGIPIKKTRTEVVRSQACYHR
jgi:hypothetical protein